MKGWSRRQVVQGAGAMGLGLLAGCGRWPGQTAAQPRNLPRVAVLSLGSERDAAVAAFIQGMSALGYVDGQNLRMDYRYAGGEYEQLPLAASALVELKPDVVVALGGPASLQAAQAATSTIPIVMVAATSDPIRQGLATTLARPALNVTGTVSAPEGLLGKRLEFLHEMRPEFTRAALVLEVNASTEWIEASARRARAAADSLGLQLQVYEVRGAQDIDLAFERTAPDRVEAIVLSGTPLIGRYAQRIATQAIERRLPTASQWPEFAQAGGLMTYGAPDRLEMVRRAAAYVDKILKGAKPVDLPLEQPMTFALTINLKTAQALGLTIPHHVLLQATEVIQ
jgi:putative tryptophan/tyrosine transport system substrate-binding protein